MSTRQDGARDKRLAELARSLFVEPVARALLDRLHAQEIRTLAELLALATALADTPETLPRALGLAPAELDRLLAGARDLLDPELAAALAKAPDITPTHFTGALPPGAKRPPRVNLARGSRQNAEPPDPSTKEH